VTGKPTDLELMMLADGELPAERAREVQAAVERDPTMRAKLEALGHLGESVKTYLETETDEAERRVPEFADMWSNIERAIRTPEHRAAPVTAPPRPREAASPGLWATLREWFEGHRAHVVTGLVSAGAVAGLMLALRPQPAAPGTTRVMVATPVPATAAAAPCPPDGPAVPRTPPEVESFEVYEGSGMVFSLPGDDADEGDATVIWISKDQDEEDPI
jgi:anti-sigma factor RsiW